MCLNREKLIENCENKQKNGVKISSINEFSSFHNNRNFNIQNQNSRCNYLNILNENTNKINANKQNRQQSKSRHNIPISINFRALNQLDYQHDDHESIRSFVDSDSANSLPAPKNSIKVPQISTKVAQFSDGFNTGMNIASKSLQIFQNIYQKLRKYLKVCARHNNANCRKSLMFPVAIFKYCVNMSSISLYMSLRQLMLVVLVLLLVTFARTTNAAPHSCMYCREEDLPKNDLKQTKNYEEFLFEHQVSRQEASDSLKALNETFYSGVSAGSSCKSLTCTKQIMKYCHGPYFINDHCWCEMGHIQEGLPYVPHICYVGEKTYNASVGSCFFYEQLKECCCGPALATQWRHISGEVRLQLPKVSTLILFILIASWT